MSLPPPVPEIPVASLDRAMDYYVHTLGFTHDWGGAEGGIAGISNGGCRLFLTAPEFRQTHANPGPMLFWLNLNSKVAVDDLHSQWQSAQAKIVSPPEDKPWQLREFTAADIDGNRIRVFYDFSRDL